MAECQKGQSLSTIPRHHNGDKILAGALLTVYRFIWSLTHFLSHLKLRLNQHMNAAGVALKLFKTSRVIVLQFAICGQFGASCTRACSPGTLQTLSLFGFTLCWQIWTLLSVLQPTSPHSTHRHVVTCEHHASWSLKSSEIFGMWRRSFTKLNKR